MCVGETEAQSTIQKQVVLHNIQADSSYYLDDWVLENSIIVRLNGEEIPGNRWQFNSTSGEIVFSESLNAEIPDSAYNLLITFEILPLSIPRNYQLMEPQKMDSSFWSEPDSLRNFTSSQTTLLRESNSNLKQSGSLSRGIIVGSNQDFSLESGLNFELSGEITESVFLNASLTDQSIPIQPDGTTQNLREFDRVYIQLEAPRTSIEMGDVDISLQQSTFARYSRRLQGAAGAYQSNFGEYSGAISSVRGTFKTMNFSGQDGFQGPYRLTGKNDQEFVIILAGTEQVYVNGQLMQRGASNDYVIDYGLGEVTFTNNMLVKDETRITMEYEYIDRDFNRTVVAAEAGQSFFNDKLQIGASVIRQADGDDLLSQQSLTEDDIALLREAGDDLNNAIVSGARLATEEERDRYVLYAKIDTTINGESTTIFRNIPGSEETKYRVQFSKVGEGKGSYKRVSGQINGLLYEYVGEGLGSYSPFRQLPAPQKQQMVALNSSYKISSVAEVFGEWAISDFDQNRYSGLDNDDNTDMAYETGVNIKEAKTAIGKVDAFIQRRYSGQNFRYFERTRDVEFDRKWNISRTGQSRESINEAGLSMSPTTSTKVGGEIGYVEREGFSGFRQASTINSNEDGWFNLTYTQDWVQSEDQSLNEDGNWFRQQGNVSKEFNGAEVDIRPYVAFEQENRLQEDLVTDSLKQISQSFYDIGPGIRIDFSAISLDAGIAYRSEKGVLANSNSLEQAATAFEQRYQIQFEPSSHFNTVNEVRIRDKQYSKAFELEGNRNRKGLLIKSETDYATKNELVDGEFLYEANTRRQSLMQETFIETGPEIGQYVWDDLNNDGTQQVNEFFPEVSVNEGTFIRQYIPSDELMPVIDLNVRLMNTIKPFALFKSENWLSDIALKSRVDITENTTTENLSDVYLLRLHTFRNDSATVQGRLYLEKELDLLRGIEKANLRAGFSENRSLSQRSSESVSQFILIRYLNTTYNLTDRTQLTLDAQNSRNRSLSSQLQNRNFDIRTFSFSPGVNGTINRSWNASLNFSYAVKEDVYPTENVAARMLKISTRHQTYLWRKLQSNFYLELRNTGLDGGSSVYGRYELTEGTGEGTHLIWSVNSSYRASNLLRLSFNYDGRTVKNRPSIHTVKLVLSATF